MALLDRYCHVAASYSVTVFTTLVSEFDMEPSPKISPFEYAVAVAQEWKKIFLFVLAAGVLAGGVSFLLPKWYVSSGTVLPPRSQGVGSLGSLSSLLRDFAPVGGGGRLGAQNQPVNYLAILKSRRMSETIVRRFDLMKVYGITNESMVETIEEFSDNLAVEVLDDGSIRIETSDKDSVRAAAMANAVIDELNAIAIELGVSEARSNRLFLEKRVTSARGDLAAAEESLRKYQEDKGMPLILSEDARSTATAVSELFAKRMRLDIELSVLRRTTGEDNSAYRQLAVERSEIERRLSAFPQLGMEAFRLYRDLLIQQKILEFLVPLYEQARIDEQRDVPVVLVLDKAVPAERKDRPKRALIVAVATLTALFGAMLFVLVRKRIHVFVARHPERAGMIRAAVMKRSIH
jgi:uncharacterized protein involved in exopolysaccharide biosynthesis